MIVRPDTAELCKYLAIKMFKILAILSIGLLTSCSTIKSAIVNNYDSNHYQLITEIRFLAHKNQSDCDDTVLSRKNSLELSEKTNFFQLYTEFIPNEGNVSTAAKELNSMSNGLSDQYKSVQQPHAAFCRIKFENIETSAKSIQKLLGERPR
jgi:hypothetical protein